MTAARYRIPPHLLLQTVRDETVILDPGSGTYYTLDAVGTRMLELYRENNDIDATVTQVTAEYEVAAATVRQDLMALLQQMVSVGLAEETGD